MVRINKETIEIGKNYMNFMEKLFLRFFINYPYDIKYIKELLKQAEKEKKQKKFIVAEDVETALKKFKKNK
jgi:hypothetical protein